MLMSSWTEQFVSGLCSWIIFFDNIFVNNIQYIRYTILKHMDFILILVYNEFFDKLLSLQIHRNN